MSIFHEFIESQRSSDTLILQPRMGFSDFNAMRNGLVAIRSLSNYNVIGTITLDSYTRVGQFEKAQRAIASGHHLNGYPICSYSSNENHRLLSGIYGTDFPVQVRHGSPLPMAIVKKIIEAGLDATEGGPISYCLPYGRTPLAASIREWAESTVLFSNHGNNLNHMESFGGCLLGQLCPPSLLVAISVLEGIFFEHYGIGSLSLSYSQGCNAQQDEGAIIALKRLAGDFLQKVPWHIVLYTFMGKFPETPDGAKKIIQDSARLAAATKCARLIVKTAAESLHIPSVTANVDAIKWCHEASATCESEICAQSLHFAEVIYEESKSLLSSILNISSNIDVCISQAFAKGLLDVPYCLHPDNKGKTTALIDSNGVVRWGGLGNFNSQNQRLWRRRI
jgi:methylaspartate mutase epsilon subunit